jgi:hypothetical protein
MQWKCLPVSTDRDGHPAIHYTTAFERGQGTMHQVSVEKLA